MAEYRHMDTKEVAARIRQELKAAFKGTKFNVRLSRYSMGSSVYVSWTDGPSPKQVEYITDRYDFSRFDGMQDLAWTADARRINGELVRASCSISHTRHHGHQACTDVLTALRAKWKEAEGLEIKPTGEHFYIDTGRLPFDAFYRDLRDMEAAWTEYPDAPSGTDEDTAAQIAEQEAAKEAAEDARRNNPEYDRIEASGPNWAHIRDVDGKLYRVQTDMAAGVGMIARMTMRQLLPLLVLETFRKEATRPSQWILSGPASPWTVQEVDETPTPKPSKPRVKVWSDGSPVQEETAPIHLTAAELLEVQQAAREAFADLLPPALLEEALQRTTAQHVTVTDHTGPVWLDAPEGMPADPTRALN